MSKSDAHLVIKIDLRPFVRAMQEIGRAISRAANNIGELFTPSGQLRRKRRTIGGMGRDAILWPTEWQSTICAGLLCGIATCPSDANGLGCTHSCHGRAAA